jgi:hypothetical protein
MIPDRLTAESMPWAQAAQKYECHLIPRSRRFLCLPPTCTNCRRHVLKRGEMWGAHITTTRCGNLHPDVASHAMGKWPLDRSSPPPLARPPRLGLRSPHGQTRGSRLAKELSMHAQWPLSYPNNTTRPQNTSGDRDQGYYRGYKINNKFNITLQNSMDYEKCIQERRHGETRTNKGMTMDMMFKTGQ